MIVTLKQNEREMQGNNTLIKETNRDPLKKFGADVLKGLLSTPKRLDSKYFYDLEGTALFRELMELPEYYLTDCELDIFKNRTHALAHFVTAGNTPFDLIELGVGDGFKSKYLLQHLSLINVGFRYMPIDISGSVLGFLRDSLKLELPHLEVKGFMGEYFEMLPRACAGSDRRKVVLFLGSNIGNMERDDCLDFCRNLRGHLCPGDMALIGFDLKKNPKTILGAYNDGQGVTARFN